ncbi:MAG: hypothetical protein IIW14_08470, partial [Kiritimatiellae bacterium]|nr:hypothetical protein [Kiritimatiellia bacterium]
TGIILKIDSYLDPARVEETTTLAVWRERYRNEITVRNKKKWWRRLVGDCGERSKCERKNVEMRLNPRGR